jgi:hypothetical protein
MTETKDPEDEIQPHRRRVWVCFKPSDRVHDRHKWFRNCHISTTSESLLTTTSAALSLALQLHIFPDLSGLSYPVPAFYGLLFSLGSTMPQSHPILSSLHFVISPFVSWILLDMIPSGINSPSLCLCAGCLIHQ